MAPPRRMLKSDPRQTSSLDRPARDPAGPAARLQQLGRGFKLSFGTLGQDRVIEGEARQKMAKSVDADANRLKLIKRLYDGHPAIRALSAARGAVDRAFKAQTNEYPDRGVRLFMVDASKIDFDQWTVEQIDKAVAEQLTEFMQYMDGHRQTYRQAVEKLQAQWPLVLAAAKQKLRELYRESDYPLASELPVKLYCNIEPVNLSVSGECQHLPPALRQEVMRLYEAKFDQAAKMQEEFVISLFSKNIEDMINSLKQYDATKDADPKAKAFFTDATVFKVHAAWNQFKQKALKYGILKGTALEKAFQQAMTTMQNLAGKTSSLPKLLREDRPTREKVVEQMSHLSETIAKLAVKGGRRQLILPSKPAGS